MRMRRKVVSAVVALLSLACLTPVLSGCHKNEDSNEPGYYNGKDFQGHGSAPGTAGGEAPVSGQGRKGGE